VGRGTSPAQQIHPLGPSSLALRPFGPAGVGPLDSISVDYAHNVVDGLSHLCKHAVSHQESFKMSLVLSQILFL